jgi:hypothetical protein
VRKRRPSRRTVILEDHGVAEADIPPQVEHPVAVSPEDASTSLSERSAICLAWSGVSSR